MKFPTTLITKTKYEIQYHKWHKSYYLQMMLYKIPIIDGGWWGVRIIIIVIVTVRRILQWITKIGLLPVKDNWYELQRIDNRKTVYCLFSLFSFNFCSQYIIKMYFKGGGVCYLVSLNSYKLQIVLVLYTSDLLNHLPVRCFQILLNKRDTIFKKYVYSSQNLLTMTAKNKV